MKKFLFLGLLLALFYNVKSQCTYKTPDFPLVSYSSGDAYSWTAGLYSLSQVGGYGTINTITIRLDNPSYASETYSNQYIYFRNTTVTDYGSNDNYPGTSGFTLVWSGNLNISGDGYYNITLSTPFNFTGTVLEVLWENKSGLIPSNDLWFDRTDASSSVKNGKFGSGWSWTAATSNTNTARSSNTAFGFNTTNAVNCDNFETSLPVELSSFSAKQESNNIKLNWVTLSELNNDFFTIEHSVDGINFKELNKIKGAGNSNKQINYSFIDKTACMGVNYYRLKQTDFDGKFSYSKVISIIKNQDKNNDVLVSYNNLNKNIKIYGSDIKQVKILDITGKIVYAGSLSNYEIKNINATSFSKGIYFVILKTENNIINKKIIITE